MPTDWLARDRPGTWGDVLGVRPYRRGDVLRRIHWPQSARHGQLVVCEVQASRPSVQIVLDTHPESHWARGRMAHASGRSESPRAWPRAGSSRERLWR